MPHGMVTISRQQINPASAYASQSHRPLKMNQMMFNRRDRGPFFTYPASSLPTQIHIGDRTETEVGGSG